MTDPSLHHALASLGLRAPTPPLRPVLARDGHEVAQVDAQEGWELVQRARGPGQYRAPDGRLYRVEGLDHDGLVVASYWRGRWWPVRYELRRGQLTVLHTGSLPEHRGTARLVARYRREVEGFVREDA